MADIKLNQLENTTDFARAYVETSTGEQRGIEVSAMSEALAKRLGDEAFKFRQSVSTCDFNQSGHFAHYTDTKDATAPDGYRYGYSAALICTKDSSGRSFQIFVDDRGNAWSRRFTSSTNKTDWKKLYGSIADLSANTITNNVNYVYGETNAGTQGKVSMSDVKSSLDINTNFKVICATNITSTKKFSLSSNGFSAGDVILCTAVDVENKSKFITAIITYINSEYSSPIHVIKSNELTLAESTGWYGMFCPSGGSGTYNITYIRIS